MSSCGLRERWSVYRWENLAKVINNITLSLGDKVGVNTLTKYDKFVSPFVTHVSKARIISVSFVHFIP